MKQPLAGLPCRLPSTGLSCLLQQAFKHALLWSVRPSMPCAVSDFTVPCLPARLRCMASAALATLLALGAPAQAQVLRCTDTRTGAVSYTDGACTPGSQAQEVAPRRSEEDMERDRAQAAEALARKQQRLDAEAAAERLDAARNARQAQQQQRTTPSDPARSPECTSARRQLQAVSARPGSGATDPRLLAAQQQMELLCLGAARYAELEKDRAARQPGGVVAPPAWSPGYPGYPAYPVHRPRPHPPVRPLPPPPRFTHCNVFRCYDAQGRSYTRP